MVYIPIDWIINKKNEDKVFEILDKVDGDVRDENSYTPLMAIKDLNKIGETILAKKVENEEIAFGA